MSAVPEDIFAPKSTLVVLTSADKDPKKLAKTWERDGSVTQHQKGYLFTFREVQVRGIHQLAELLSSLEADSYSCVLRGRYVGDDRATEEYLKLPAKERPPEGKHRRLAAIFEDQPSHYLLGDIDGYAPEGIDPVADPVAAIEQFIAKKLPPEFQGVTYFWALSGSAGHPDSAGKLKAHIAFWMKTPLTGDQLDAWNYSIGKPFDASVFGSNHINYTAAPVIAPGVSCPVVVRSGLQEGWASDVVDFTVSAVVELRARGARKMRTEMVDPRDKDNLIGQFCRTFEIEEVVERWLGDVFEFVTDTRLNFLRSSNGAAEGAGVTDNRQGIFNTHDSDPFNKRAANKWDLVRHYKFGHLDDGRDDFELLDIWSRPSQAAMKEFVLQLPEIRAEMVDASTTHRAAIDAAPDEAAVRDVAQRIALDSSLDRLGREMLIGAIQARLRQLTGVKPPIQAVRALVTMDHARAPVEVQGGPAWVQPWCYVTSQARFFNRNTKELITREAFDAAHGRLMPVDEDGNVPSAARVACDIWHIPIVYNLMYLPSAGDLFSLDGREHANLYRPESVPVGVVDPAANAVLMRHVELLIPDATYREVFLQWAAWVVLNPGMKVLWALLVKGVEGDGKSVLGFMIAQAMGHENVGIISPETLAGSNFNDWAVGRCVNVLEELKMQGHNRHDVYNKVKPLITNPRIEVHGKGKASMTAVNTTNYIGFTNHDDALPLDDMDRRHFVLFTPWRSISEMHAAVAAMGLDMEAYWEQLWAVVKQRPEAVRGFFESIDISTFNPNSRAPATVFKQAVVAAGDLDDAEGYARFHIEEGCYGVSTQVVSSACLTKALADLDPPVHIHTTRVRKLLKSMGFEPVPGFIKWNGAAHRVWVKVTDVEVTGLSKEEVRAMLDATTNKAVEDFLR